MTLEEYGRDFDKQPSIMRFLCAFINADGFMDSKRFVRYVSKVKRLCDQLIQEEYKQHIDVYKFVAHEVESEALIRYRNLKESDCAESSQADESNVLSSNNLETISLSQLQYYIQFQDDNKIMNQLNKNFTYCYEYAFIDPHEVQLWEIISSIFLKYEYLKDLEGGYVDSPEKADLSWAKEEKEDILQNYKTVHDMIGVNFATCCWMYLRDRIAEEHSTINLDNFLIIGLPRGDGEIMSIIANVVDRSITDIMNCVRPENLVQISARTDYKMYKKEIETLQSENKKMETSLLEEQNKNSMLRNKLTEYDTVKQKEFAVLKEDNNKLAYENSLLKKRKMALEEECEKLKAKIAELQLLNTEVSVPEVVEEGGNLDFNKRYVFVMDGNPYGEEQLLKTFPNAIIISDNINLNPQNVDMVVCITSRVKHCVYDPIKAQCKSKEIPFVHSVSHNVEIVKKVLAEFEA